MSYSIYLQPAFEKRSKRLIKKFPSLKSELATLISTLMTQPKTGTPLGDDCYKIRVGIASKGKGKSGGARVITCVKIIHNTVHLLTIYDKSEQADLSSSELRELLSNIEFTD